MSGEFIEKETDDNKVIVIGTNEQYTTCLNPKYGMLIDIEEEEMQQELKVGGFKTFWKCKVMKKYTKIWLD